MRLKSFTARNMREAMQMVRETLGEDAIIVATREENAGHGSFARVSVTAAIERDRDLPGMDAEDDAWMYGDRDSDENSIADDVTEIMLRHAVPEDVLDHIVTCANVMGLEEPREALCAVLDELFRFRPLPVRPFRKPLLLAGPPGAGKTLAAAKLAARGAMNGLHMAVITTDVVRAGGVEQLAAFTRLMDIELMTAETPKDLKECLLKAGGADQIVIDTAGVNPFQPEGVRDLARLIGAAEITPLLVLPAGTDADESGEIARVFSTIGTQVLLPTRIDVARRLGSLLSAAHHGSMAFADASDTAQVADGLTPLSAARLAQLLMPSPVRNRNLRQPVRHTGTG